MTRKTLFKISSPNADTISSVPYSVITASAPRNILSFRPLQAKSNRGEARPAAQGRHQLGEPSRKQPRSPPRLAQGPSQEGTRHIFLLSSSSSLGSLMFKHKFQEQPDHKNKERLTYYGTPPMARRCAVPQFPCVYIVSTQPMSPQSASSSHLILGTAPAPFSGCGAQS